MKTMETCAECKGQFPVGPGEALPCGHSRRKSGDRYKPQPETSHEALFATLRDAEITKLREEYARSKDALLVATGLYTDRLEPMLEEWIVRFQKGGVGWDALEALRAVKAVLHYGEEIVEAEMKEWEKEEAATDAQKGGA